MITWDKPKTLGACVHDMREDFHITVILRDNK
jgi:hypothetical protein